MIVKYKCPRCGSRKWKMTRSKNRIWCKDCNFVSKVMTDDQIKEILDYVPTPFEACMEEIMECSHECEYEDEPCITLDCLEDILKKYLKPTT